MPAFRPIIWKVIILLLATHLIAMVWSILSFRGLISDGAYIIVEVINSKLFHFETFLLKFHSILPQLPAVIWLWISERPTWESVVQVYFLGYGIYPLLGLGICYYLAIQSSRREFIIFPLLSFAMATQTVTVFPFLGLIEALTIFWILFFLLFIVPQHNLKIHLVCVGLTLFLALGHETTLLLTLFLALALSIAPLKKDEGEFSRRCMIALMVLVTGYFIWRLGVLALPDDKRSFWKMIFYPFDLFIKYILLNLVLVAASLVGFKSPRLLSSTAVLLALGFVFCFLFLWPEEFRQIPLKQERLLTIPICIALAAMCGFCVRWGGRSPSALGIILICLLFSGAVRDFYLTAHWRKGYFAFQEMLRQNPGCNVVQRKDFSKLGNVFPLISEFFVPYMSIATQGYKLDSIFLTESNLTGQSCSPKEGFLSSSDQPEIGVTFYDRIDFSGALSGPVRLHRFDKESAKWITALKNEQ